MSDENNTSATPLPAPAPAEQVKPDAAPPAPAPDATGTVAKPGKRESQLHSTVKASANVIKLHNHLAPAIQA